MSRRKPRAKIYAPQVWPAWCLIGIAWLVARLPLSVLYVLGRGIGSALYLLAGSRRHITEVNVALCFAELDAEQQKAMVKLILQHVAIGALELMIPWLNPSRDLSSRFEVTGTEHLRAAQAMGRGVILVGGHFAVMDVISQPVANLGGVDVMYRENKNPAWEWLQVSGRQRYFERVIERNDTRSALRCLKAGRTLWYAADQDYGSKHSVFAPFFGQMAASINATSRFARLNNSPVLLMSQHRNLATRRWTIHFTPILEDFPSGNDLIDATRLNALLESEIRKDPAQYLWIHRRFKTRPPGEPKLY